MACCGGELGAKYPFEHRSPQISVNLSRQTALVVEEADGSQIL
jgi:hypothetical protein